MINNLGSMSGTAILDFKSSTHYFLSTTGSVSLSFKNWPTAGICGSIRLTISITNILHTMSVPGTVSRGLYNIAGLTSKTINGLVIKPPTTIVSGSATTYTVSATQTVGNATNTVSFTATSAAGAVATFSGYIVGVTLTVTSAITGTIAAGMTLAETGGLGPSTIAFAVPGDYVFDFETIDNGTSILIMDQSRASNVENVSYTGSTLSPATAGVLGGIKIGAGLSVTADGTASVKIATKLAAGMVKIGTGLAVAADGTVSVVAPDAGAGAGAGASAVGAPTNNSLVFGQIEVGIALRNNTYNNIGSTWTKLNVSIRIPAAGSYRFRILGCLYRWYSVSDICPGQLRIYVNGVNSSAADITFPQADIRVVGSGNGDFTRDITGLARGDKIELYYQYARPAGSGAYEYIAFTMLVAGENSFGIYPLSDYSLSTTKYPGIIKPTTTLILGDPEP
jgi:hypothetical protein